MKQLLDFIPVVLFVAVYYATGDIFASTAVLLAGLFIALVYEYLDTGSVSRRTLVIFSISVLFGGATLVFRNQTFIQWKPTVVNWIFSATLLASQYGFKRNLLQQLLGSQLELPHPVWRTLDLGWALGFFLAGVLNLIVAYQFSLAFWVSYKLFGGFLITAGYIMITVIYLARGGYLKDPTPKVESTQEGG